MNDIAPDAETYSRTAVLLHWAGAALILTLLVLGFWMETIPRKTPDRNLYLNLHKSLGLLAAALILIRVAVRARTQPPRFPSSLPPWQQTAARWSHRLLYACMILQPLAGYLSSSFNKYGVRFFGLQLPHWGWEDPALRSLFSGVLSAIAWTLSVLICLHVLAAVRHGLRGRNEILRRMLPPRHGSA
jgi:cytochrome b561